MPSFIYQSDIDTTQVRYINEFFPEIAQRIGGAWAMIYSRVFISIWKNGRLLDNVEFI